MGGHIRLSAVCIGALLGYVMPIGLLFWFPAMIFGGKNLVDLFGALSTPMHYVTMLLVHVGGPIYGGFIAAQRGKVQPQLHGLLAALIGWTISTFSGNGIIVGALYVIESLIGVAIWRRRVH